MNLAINESVTNKGYDSQYDARAKPIIASPYSIKMIIYRVRVITIVKMPIRRTNLLPVFFRSTPTIGEQTITANEYVLKKKLNV